MILLEARPANRLRCFATNSPETSTHQQSPGIPKRARRQILSLPVMIGVASLTRAFPGYSAVEAPPPGKSDTNIDPDGLILGYFYYRDPLDGYEFLIKDDWVRVPSTGNEVAYRNLLHPDQNLFVNISSPSTSKFSSVKDLGTPERAGQKILARYLSEFMSTRIGVRREGEFLSGEERAGADGKTYYDVEVRLRSFATRNQLAVTGEERQRGMEKEWERRLLTVIGVANRREYDLRFQADVNASPSDLEVINKMAKSFRCYEVNV